VKVVAFPAVIREVCDHFHALIESEIQLAHQRHEGHDVEWKVAAKSLALGILTLYCSTCDSRWSWSLSVASRNLSVPVPRYTGYKRRKGERD
jgi:hypothetical protein